MKVMAVETTPEFIPSTGNVFEDLEVEEPAAALQRSTAARRPAAKRRAPSLCWQRLDEHGRTGRRDRRRAEVQVHAKWRATVDEDGHYCFAVAP